jgi:hypothetical protein
MTVEITTSFPLVCLILADPIEKERQAGDMSSHSRSLRFLLKDVPVE